MDDGMIVERETASADCDEVLYFEALVRALCRAAQARSGFLLHSTGGAVGVGGGGRTRAARLRKRYVEEVVGAAVERVALPWLQRHAAGLQGTDVDDGDA